MDVIAVAVALFVCLVGLIAIAVVMTGRRRIEQEKRKADALAASSPVAAETGGVNAVDDPFVTWSPDTLRQILDTRFPDEDVIVVSNREPYVHDRVDGEIRLSVPASGLVSALEPITRATRGTWIAHGSGTADRETVDDHDRVGVPPQDPAYSLRRVWLSEDEQKGYYAGFANEGLWPLCHIAFTRPVFRASDWEAYRNVNQKFADIVVEEAKTRRPVVLVQDYHFALLPRMIRERLPEAIIITFWHIPWPNAEIFSVCPWREEILEGLLGSSILGFHIQLHCNNFTESADRFLESRIDREDSSITYNGLQTRVNAYPISIAWPDEGDMTDNPQDARAEILARYDLGADVRLAVGVERLDYTKGILDRFQALDEFFQSHPDWIGKLVFLQVAAPSRAELPAYRRLHEECVNLVESINGRHGTADWKPIILIDEHNDQQSLKALYQSADLCVVSSLHDGMNLVAKEFVAARSDERGILILSAFAGASRELPEALLVNPFDTVAMGETFYQALTMNPQEIRERMRRMRATVRDNNVYRWAGSMLLDAARLKEKQSPFRASPTLVHSAPEPRLAGAARVAAE